MGTLSTDQRWAFIEETTSTRNLLAYGIHALREAPFIDTTLDPILTLLSIGVEKLLKLYIGVISVDDSGVWKTYGQMRDYGHSVSTLFGEVMTATGSRMTGATEYVRELVREVDADPLLPPLIAVLDRYAREGRFYNLDRLAERTQKDEKPSDAWLALENRAADDPTLSALLARAMDDLGNHALWDEYHSKVQDRIADSLEHFWGMLARAGRNGVFGDLGKDLGCDIGPDSVGRQRHR